MAEPEDVEIDLKADDYRKDIFHAGGPGGQHVNKTASADPDNSLHTGHRRLLPRRKEPARNLAKALRVLETGSTRPAGGRAQETFRRAEDQDRLRRPQPADPHLQLPRKPADRSPHQLTLYKLDNIIAGNLNPVIDALMEYERQEQRAAFGTID